MKFKWYQLIRTPYNVMMTDYFNALVYSCQDYLIFHYPNTWVLSRTTNLTVGFQSWEKLRMQAETVRIMLLQNHACTFMHADTLRSNKKEGRVTSL